MSAKPQDVFIGLVEFFAIVLPGAILTYFISVFAADAVGTTLPGLRFSAERWIAFLVASYVIGHVLHQAGWLIDWTYNCLYVKCFMKCFMRRKRKKSLRARTQKLSKRPVNHKGRNGAHGTAVARDW